MPLRPFTREQGWLLPPSLGELVPEDHPARFVAAFVDAIETQEWLEMGIDPKGEELGRPAYHPQALLGVWLYGFMSGIRSARKLEAACREGLPYLWLSGLERPDHNTLWRFYRAHREGMRKLFRRSVRTAVKMGLVSLALQAVDGTKVAGNATGERTFDKKGLGQLLKRTEAAILDLEAQNVSGEGVSARLPQKLARAKDLGEQVRAALELVDGEGGVGRVNLTDEDTRLVQSRGKIIAGYNAQAVVVGLREEAGKGFIITGAAVTNAADDHAQLVPMLGQAEEMVGEKAEVNLADGGYYSGENLSAVAQRGWRVLMPEVQSRSQLRDQYHRDNFEYDAETDSYLCPYGETLRFRRLRQDESWAQVRVYQGQGRVCRGCVAFGKCTKDKRHGRELAVGQHESKLKEHRLLMESGSSRELYSHRKEIIEPVFGILKECLGARRFHLRGLSNVAAEWSLLAACFNLKTLWKSWLLMEESQRSAFFRMAS
jgi:transposase